MLQQRKKTKIIKLEDKKLNKIMERIQKNEGVTSEELNKLWNNFVKSDV